MGCACSSEEENNRNIKTNKRNKQKSQERNDLHYSNHRRHSRNEYNEENVQKFINQFIRAKQEFGESTDIAETTSADDFSF